MGFGHFKGILPGLSRDKDADGLRILFQGSEWLWDRNDFETLRNALISEALKA